MYLFTHQGLLLLVIRHESYLISVCKISNPGMTFLQVLLLMVLPSACGYWRINVSRRNKARKAIILCCGRNKCLDVIAKKRISSIGGNGTNRMHSTPITKKIATSSASLVVKTASNSFASTSSAALDQTIESTEG